MTSLSMVASQSKREFTLTGIERHTHTVTVFTLKPKKSEVINFKPGMFVTLTFEHDGKKYGPKPYSVSSSPLVKNELEVTIRKEGFFTQALFKLEEGATINVQGPYGKFVLHEPVAEHTVLIAGGTGIAPMMSMLRHILDTKAKTHVTLLFSCKTEHDIIFKEELNRRSRTSDNFSYIQTLTQEPEDSAWQGHRGRISDTMIKQHVRTKEARYYLCGPNDFVTAVEEALDELNIPAERIHHEKWG